MPFGVLTEENSGVEWDIRLTQDDLHSVLKQFEAVQKGPRHFASFNCCIEQAGMIMEVLKDNDYKFVCPVYWLKTAQTSITPQNQLTPACEVLIVARKQTTGNIAICNLDQNPTKRTNVITGPSNQEYLKTKTGEKVNPTQKPEYLIQWILERFANPGSTVLILGSGAGGEVRGALAAGHHVTGLDLDMAQLTALHADLVNYDHNVEAKRQSEELKAAKAAKAAPKVAANPPAVAISSSSSSSSSQLAVSPASPAQPEVGTVAIAASAPPIMAAVAEPSQISPQPVDAENTGSAAGAASGGNPDVEAGGSGDVVAP
jgi:hypothetical protein